MEPSGSGGRVSNCDEELFGGGARALVVQADNKVVILRGSFVFGDGFDATTFLISRYNTDGTLDTSFGNGGRVISTFGADDIFAEALVLQRDGNLVVAGSTGTPCFIHF